MKYRIIRFHKDGEKAPEIVATDLTLEQARAHCHDPATKTDDWFDGYGAQPTSVGKCDDGGDPASPMRTVEVASGE